MELDIWNIIDKFFKETPDHLVSHHLESYNDFFKNGILRIFKEKNPVRINSNFDPEIDDYRNQCHLYFGGKNGDKLYFGKPIIYDNNDNSHYMFPNEARLRNMTYGMTIHYDIEVEFIDILKDGQQPYMLGGGNETISELHERASDYIAQHQFKNFKEQAPLEVDGTDDTVTIKGGAKKVARSKRVQREFKMTPAMASALREATEKSMIEPNVQKRTITIEKAYLGKFPIMVQSDFCILKGLSPEVRYTMGECRQDVGGYFIIQGKEKTVICQEKFADNMLYIRKYGPEDKEEDEIDAEYLYSSEVRSVSENASKPIRTLSVKIVAPTASYTNKNIVVSIPNVKKPVPLFIVFRALGVISDKSIIEMCLLNIEKYEHMVDLFIPSVHDAGGILTQKLALEFIASLTKGKRIEHALEIMADYFLPHIGEVNYVEKAYYLGHMVFRMLSVSTGFEQPTDRDNFKYKRIELVGSLLYDLFREYYADQQKYIQVEFDKRLNLNLSLYGNDLPLLIQTFQTDLLKERVLEAGFKRAFKGNWGARANTKRIGVVQDLTRLSFNGTLSHLRKTNLPMDSGAKLVGPRVLHSSQWGFIDPIDTPDGGNIGLHKTLAIATYVTRGGNGTRETMVAWLREKMSMKAPEEYSPRLLSELTKVFVNGYWAGSVAEPIECIQKIKLYRRNGLIPIYTSATFDIKTNTIYIYTDGGRMCRPIFYRDEITTKLSYETPDIIEKLKNNDFTWKELIYGFNPKRKGVVDDSKIYELFEMYEGISSETNPAKIDRFIHKKAIIDYIDSSESENTLIAINPTEFPKKNYTHLEIHESLLLGTMCNLINFPENNPPTRNSFSCGQSKQACSVYHTNYLMRMDKTAVVLNNGQTPLVKSRYMEYINHEENPYGENAIVAIMCYTGYNMEDSILVNEGALKRGLFNTTYYTTYESHEEVSDSPDGKFETKFTNIESESDVVGTKPGYDYGKLDKFGLIREGTEVDDKTVLIGMATSSKDRMADASKTPKKGQLGIVDRTFMTEGDEGERIAKVRLREVRIPNLGDKMASRAGQKGTVGLVVPECDMPFTKDGLRPDMIINPHAIPSRMTIGQLIECVMGKTCAMMGGFGDCTAFVNKGSKIGVFGEALSRFGYHSSGNEILYNGMTGQQLESEIFIGPTYYMRLKHMVKDKINFRARGPMTALTRQPVSGRANDGGLRIGEMERDSVISHGMVDFLTESMMERGDKYKMAVCNTTGLIAIYNPAKNLFLSPMADGPLRFVGSLDGKDLNIDNVSQFGRSFSIVSVPYSLKLLIQELQAINIQMRLITEDNIDQMETMAFSNNIEKLSGLTNFNDFKNKIKTSLNITNDYEPTTDTPQSATTPMSILSSIFTPSTPDLSTPEFKTPQRASASWSPSSPEYAPGSPLYQPSTPDFPPPKSPLYQPSTPDFPPPKSPTYQPTTPDYPPPADLSTSPGYPPSPEYEEGEIVYYRGDKNNPPVPWNIEKVGKDIITITNSSGELEVVSKYDLYTELPPAPMKSMTGGMSMAPMPVQRENTQPMTGGIDFHPMIFIGGNADGIGSRILDGGSSETMPTSAQAQAQAQVQESAPVQAPTPAPEPESSMFGGLLDFSRLIVKKQN
jgi:DNA-directed RNA polymerase II subunit RPB2